MNGCSENSVFWVNTPTFWPCHNFSSYTIYSSIYSHVPKQIRSRTIPKPDWNGLNILSYNEKYCLLGTFTMEWDGWNIIMVSISGLLHNISWLVFLWHKHIHKHTAGTCVLEKQVIKHIHYLFSSQHTQPMSTVHKQVMTVTQTQYMQK